MVSEHSLSLTPQAEHAIVGWRHGVSHDLPQCRTARLWHGAPCVVRPHGLSLWDRSRLPWPPRAARIL